MKFDATILDYLRTGSWVGGSQRFPSCPVDTEKGKSYVRYDGLRLGNSQDANGGVMVQFTFQGAAVAWVHIYGTTLDSSRHLWADGEISGRLLVTKE